MIWPTIAMCGAVARTGRLVMIRRSPQSQASRRMADSVLPWRLITLSTRASRLDDQQALVGLALIDDDALVVDDPAFLFDGLRPLFGIAYFLDQALARRDATLDATAKSGSAAAISARTGLQESPLRAFEVLPTRTTNSFAVWRVAPTWVWGPSPTAQPAATRNWVSTATGSASVWGMIAATA